MWEISATNVGRKYRPHTLEADIQIGRILRIHLKIKVCQHADKKIFTPQLVAGPASPNLRLTS